MYILLKLLNYLLGRPETFSSGRPYVLAVMFFSFRRTTSRAPSADRSETLPHDRNLGELYNASPTVREALPPKEIGGQNMHNSARFQTTSDFDREYRRNVSRYPKSDMKCNPIFR